MAFRRLLAPRSPCPCATRITGRTNERSSLISDSRSALIDTIVSLLARPPTPSPPASAPSLIPSLHRSACAVGAGANAAPCLRFRRPASPVALVSVGPTDARTHRANRVVAGAVGEGSVSGEDAVAVLTGEFADSPIVDDPELLHGTASLRECHHTFQRILDVFTRSGSVRRSTTIPANRLGTNRTVFVKSLSRDTRRRCSARHTSINVPSRQSKGLL